MSETSGSIGAYGAWVGRSEQSCDTITAGPLDRLAATLDRDTPRVADGDAVTPLGHWLFFLPDARQSEIGPDGHPKRGGFLPPVNELPRRMWAGSRITFRDDVHVGDKLSRRSVIRSVKHKDGASGPLVFVTVRHEICRVGQPVSIVDEHDIVYRGLQAPTAKPSPQMAKIGAWRREFTPDAVQLFRYSALTFNSHRIHYDRDYVTRQEGYPGLVVHGPLIATLLLELIRVNAPHRRVTEFSFRALSPLFDGDTMSINADPPGADGHIRLWAANAQNNLAMTAEARIA